MRRPDKQGCQVRAWNITARKRREWGFHTPQGWVDWRDYHGITREAAE